MARRKDIRSKEQFDQALLAEKAGDIKAAIKGYQKSATTDPTNTNAWNRLMILFRKTKTKEEELRLIKNAINEYQQAKANQHRDWLKANREKADSSRALAEVLGLLEPSGSPMAENTIVEKWQTRHYLLAYRLKNARKQKPKVSDGKKNGTKRAKAKPAVLKTKKKTPSKTKSQAKIKNGS